MADIHEVLHKYWGYPAFRPMQEQIIQSVLDGKDTLALMPTGGGKSLTYQVPTLAREGMCLVITPLIALMRDQVERLGSLGVKAAMVFSGMSSAEIDIVLTNAVFGEYKFLYVAPERLGTDIFIHKVQEMNISLMAVDEAHCISQWGYDFRPSYLQIADIRQYIPGVPVLAVTATATRDVAEDICDKLNFSGRNIIRTGFERPNLAYVVREVPDKLQYLLRIHSKARGSGLVYVRSRRKTQEVADYLCKHGVSAGYYHAGMSDQLRNVCQTEWMTGQKEVVVATTAFGMGIDKPDVRYVVHLDVPDSLEEYFQESGRAGRDGRRSWAVLLYNDADKLSIRARLDTRFPDMDYLRQIYSSLGNFLQVPLWECENVTIPFDFQLFTEKYKLNPYMAYNALKIIEREGYIHWDENTSVPTRVIFTASREDLYAFRVRNEALDDFIKLLLRSYTGLFTEYTPINEEVLASRAKVPVSQIHDWIKQLYHYQIIKYIPHTELPLVTYLMRRVDDSSFFIPRDHLSERRSRAEKRMSAMLGYLTSDKCRSRMLLDYFGQEDSAPCGHCDYCDRKHSAGVKQYELDRISSLILDSIGRGICAPEQIQTLCKYPPAKFQSVLRWMADQGMIIADKAGRLGRG